jgi:hypothetical protein
MPLDHSKSQFWVKRFDRFRQSGLTIAQFCRDEKIAVPSFNYWRKLSKKASFYYARFFLRKTASLGEKPFSGERFFSKNSF